MGKPLRPDLIIQRSKSDRLDMVKSLNLWGNDIDDVSILTELPNVEILSLSVNRISSLEDFKYCSKLTELYLRKNMVSDLGEVQHLRGLKHLKVLWLWDNPISEDSNYRNYIINALPQLTKLDNQAVTSDEKTSAASAPQIQQPGRVQRSPPQQRKVQRSPPPQQPQQRNGGGNIQHSPPAQRGGVQRSPPPVARQSAEPPAHHNAYADPAPPVNRSPRQNQAPRNGTHENILCAILALMKELDESGLELIKREADRKLRG